MEIENDHCINALTCIRFRENTRQYEQSFTLRIQGHEYNMNSIL